MSKPVFVIKTLEDSPSWLDRRLVFAYLHAYYRVPELGLEIRIGVNYPAYEAGLRRRGIGHFFYITAFNPGSTVLPGAANVQRNRLMQERLLPLSDLILPGISGSPAGDWPPEEGFLVAGLDPETAVTTAQAFEQNAIVHGKTGFAPELWWVGLPSQLV